MGTPLKTLIKGRPWLLHMLLETYGQEKYLLVPNGNTINIILRDSAQCSDVPVAYMHACLIRKRLKNEGLIDLGVLVLYRIQ